MPTSPRDLTDSTGGMIRTNHPLWPRTFRADVGIRPYAGGRFCHSTWPGLYFHVSPPHPPPAGGTLSKQERAGAARTGLPENLRAFPFTLARFFGRAGFPSSVPGCARSTFPVGEGDLRRGLLDFDSAQFLCSPHCFNPRKRCASGGTDHYISCRPSRARDRVTSSAYSSWLPTGTP